MIGYLYSIFSSCTYRDNVNIFYTTCLHPYRIKWCTFLWVEVRESHALQTPATNHVVWISTRRGHNHLPRDLVKPHDPTLRPHRWCTNEPTMAASVLTQRPARRSSFLWSRHTRVDVQGDLGGSGFITEAKDPGQMRLSWQQRSLLRFFEVCCDRACGLLRGKGRIRWMGPTWRWQEIHVNLTVRGACDEAWETSPWAPWVSRVVERKMKGIRWVDGCLIGPFSERRGRSGPRGMRAREAGKVRYTFFFISSFLFLFKFYFFLVQISNSS